MPKNKLLRTLAGIAITSASIGLAYNAGLYLITSSEIRAYEREKGVESAIDQTRAFLGKHDSVRGVIYLGNVLAARKYLAEKASRP